jgi:hypothetical protein
VGAGKSGVGGGEWKVSSPQFSVLFSREEFTNAVSLLKPKKYPEPIQVSKLEPWKIKITKFPTDG